MIILPSSLHLILDALKQNVPAVFPTETVYGLGANAYDDAAVKEIFSIKNRPSFNPLIVHYASLEAVLKDGYIPDDFIPFLAQLWPGPLTVIVKKNEKSAVSSYVTAGLSTLAVRVPCHPLATKLLQSLDFPLAAPSANTSGFLSPTTAHHVYDDLKDKVPYILDGGPCTVGIESTIIDITQNPVKILRPGSVLIDHLAIESLTSFAKSDSIQCPGQLENHYAPSKGIRLNAINAQADEGYLVFGEVPQNQASIVLQLSVNRNLEEAAKNLFNHLHILDQSAVKKIAVMPIPNEGIGIAINDRLRRAAAPLKKGETDDIAS